MGYFDGRAPQLSARVYHRTPAASVIGLMSTLRFCLLRSVIHAEGERTIILSPGMVAERMAVERLMAEEMVAERMAVERLMSEGMVAERMVAERMVAESRVTISSSSWINIEPGFVTSTEVSTGGTEEPVKPPRLKKERFIYKKSFKQREKNNFIIPVGPGGVGWLVITKN